MGGNDFYEDDEPIDELIALFESGEKEYTAPPSRGVTKHVDFSNPGSAPTLSVETNHTSRELAGI